PKPDLAGFDGVSISNAGGFPACPPSCAFFGTSPATPHSAAVAALLLSKNPSLTPAHIQEALRGGALDIGPAGFDEAAGAGRLDALAAAALVCTADAQCDDANACTVDARDHGPCAPGRSRARSACVRSRITASPTARTWTCSSSRAGSARARRSRTGRCSTGSHSAPPKRRS